MQEVELTGQSKEDGFTAIHLQETAARVHLMGLPEHAREHRAADWLCSMPKGSSFHGHDCLQWRFTGWA